MTIAAKRLGWGVEVDVSHDSSFAIRDVTQLGISSVDEGLLRDGRGQTKHLRHAPARATRWSLFASLLATADSECRRLG
jgi:hypothetical protein